jgi:hypothetical protein
MKSGIKLKEMYEPSMVGYNCNPSYTKADKVNDKNKIQNKKGAGGVA